MISDNSCQRTYILRMEKLRNRNFKLASNAQSTRFCFSPLCIGQLGKESVGLGVGVAQYADAGNILGILLKH